MIRWQRSSLVVLCVWLLGCASAGQRIHEKLAQGLHDEALTLAKAHVRRQGPDRLLEPKDAAAIREAIEANFAAAAKTDDPDAYRIFRNRVSGLPGAQATIGKADRAEIEAMLRQARTSKRPQVFQMVQRRATELSVAGDLLDRAMAGEVRAAYAAALKVGSIQALREFSAAYGDRLDADLRKEVREEQAKLALFGANQPKDLRAREALITRFGDTQAAQDARVKLLDEQLKIAQARGLPGLRAFIATSARRKALDEWISKARVHEADLLRQKAQSVTSAASLKGFMSACGGHALCRELSANAEGRLLQRQLKPVGISRAPHWTKSCWPKPAEALIKKASSVFCVERAVAKRAPLSSFNKVLYRARSQDLRQLITLYLARRELDGLIATKNKRRLEHFVSRHAAQPLTAELAKEAKSALAPPERPQVELTSAADWLSVYLKGIDTTVLGTGEGAKETSLAASDRKARQQAEVRALERALKGKPIAVSGCRVNDVEKDPKSDRAVLSCTLRDGLEFDGKATVNLSVFLPAGTAVAGIKRGSRQPVVGQVRSVVYQGPLETLVLEVE